MLLLLLHTGDERNRAVNIVILIISVAHDRSELCASILDRRDVLHGCIPVGESWPSRSRLQSDRVRRKWALRSDDVSLNKYHCRLSFPLSLPRAPFALIRLSGVSTIDPHCRDPAHSVPSAAKYLNS